MFLKQSNAKTLLKILLTFPLQRYRLRLFLVLQLFLFDFRRLLRLFLFDFTLRLQRLRIHDGLYIEMHICHLAYGSCRYHIEVTANYILCNMAN